MTQHDQSRRTPTGASGWTVRCEQGILRLQATTRGGRRTADDETTVHLRAAEDALEIAAATLAGFRSSSILRRLLTSSATYVEVLACLQTATEQLLYLQSDEALLGMVPDLAGAVRNFLAAEDPRRETYLTYLTNLQQRGLEPPASTRPGPPQPGPGRPGPSEAGPPQPGPPQSGPPQPGPTQPGPTPAPAAPAATRTAARPATAYHTTI